MTNDFPGTASDQLPEVTATGRTDITAIFTSMSARDPDGRDADFLKWHSLDHRPEQHRIAKLRASLRLVSTPACRRARAACEKPYDAADHVMTYFFTDADALPGFVDLGTALANGGRMSHLLPPVERGVYRLGGKIAAPRVKVGADVLPWWPAQGVYLLLERGAAPASELVDVPGVGGAWWGGVLPLNPPYASITETDVQITYCFLDGEPVATAERLGPVLNRRWDHSGVKPLLAAPFHVVDPYQWDRFLP